MKIIKRSNVIQYDIMGYPLRLCIVSTDKSFGAKTDQIWIDTMEQAGDVVLQWAEVEE